jgi:UDP-2,3-diacylglucosamine pyrophosphatase LpxH
VSGKHETYKLIISDIHLGPGNAPGEFNPMEDFHYDSVLAEFLEYHSTGRYESADVELILNGDFLDPLKADVNGTFPDRITNAVALKKVGKCLNGHPTVVEGLRSFISRPNKRITYIMGNHDLEIAFLSVQELFRTVIGAPKYHSRISFRVFEPNYDLPGGIRVCHGQQLEALNRVNLSQLFLTRGYAEPVLNLPWGSIFFLKVLLPFKHERPYINLVHPLGRYLSIAVVTDTSVALPASIRAIYYFLKTRFVEAHKRAVSFRQTLKILKEEAILSPDLEDSARAMLEEEPSLAAVVMGHSHGAKVRRYKRRGAVYINTGTWTKLINLDLADLGVHTRFTYALVRYSKAQEPPEVGLFRWFGTQGPFMELRY